MLPAGHIVPLWNNWNCNECVKESTAHCLWRFMKQFFSAVKHNVGDTLWTLDFHYILTARVLSLHQPHPHRPMVSVGLTHRCSWHRWGRTSALLLSQVSLNILWWSPLLLQDFALIAKATCNFRFEFEQAVYIFLWDATVCAVPVVQQTRIHKSEIYHVEHNLIPLPSPDLCSVESKQWVKKIHSSHTLRVCLCDTR